MLVGLPLELVGERLSGDGDSVADVRRPGALAAAPPRGQLGEVQLRADGLQEPSRQHRGLLARPVTRKKTKKKNVIRLLLQYLFWTKTCLLLLLDVTR